MTRLTASRLFAVANVVTVMAAGTLARPGVAGARAVAAEQAAVEVLHTFTGPDGAHPGGALIQTTDGLFYGTTPYGGRTECVLGCGTVYRMTADGTVRVLHAFKGGVEGAHPAAALIQATDGNFYGTTVRGGLDDAGTVFRMMRDGTVTVVHSFNYGTEGGIPRARVTQALDGNLYGTTSSGGTFDQGTIFKMTLDGTVTVLHEFGATQDDGAGPATALLEVADGNFYGTTVEGGAWNLGTVFRMDPDGTVTTLVAFTGEADDGNAPLGDLIQTSGGSVYGSTFFGGAFNQGIIFDIISEITSGIRHEFTGGPDGARPKSALLQAADRNLYGTAAQGGGGSCALGCGTVFRLTLDDNFTVLHKFTGADDGSGPDSALIQGTDGKLYGVTENGGGAGVGVVFRLAVP